MTTNIGNSDRQTPSGGDSPTTVASLPTALRLGHVRLQVGDLARSLEYYEGVLGLEAREHGEGSVMLTAADGQPLVELVAVPGTMPVQPHGRLGLYHFALLLPDRAALGRFLAHLARTGTRLGASDHLVSEAIYLRDPDGLGIEVYADRPRESWRRTDGQLEMTTAPLDTEAVLAAGRGEPWDGMPAGTVMGHVHLHVADIEEASRFYRDALGFDRTVWNYPGALFLSAGGYHHHLGVNTWAGAQAVAPSDDEARLLDWRIVLPSVAEASATAARLGDAGYPATPADGGWLVADPWGTRFRLTGA